MWPVSTMSSTTITCLPSIGRDRSCVIWTTPDDTRRVAVRRDADEVDVDGQRDVAHEVGQEDHRALEHADDDDVGLSVAAA